MRATSAPPLAFLQVVVHPLRLVEPLPLAFVAAEHLQLGVHFAGDVDEQLGHDEGSHPVAVRVRLGVVEVDVLVGRLGRRIAAVVPHGAAEARGDHQPGGIRVVFHVIVQRREHDRRPVTRTCLIFRNSRSS